MQRATMFFLSKQPLKTFKRICFPNKTSRTFTVPATPKTLSSEKILNLLHDISSHDSSYGFHTKYFTSLQRKKILVEFSSPNIAKLFHAGHYRSTVIGNAISNILIAAGHDVCKINYLGDWGFQFALLAVSYQRYGDEYRLKKEPLRYLFDLYVRISAEVKSDSSIYDEAQSIFAAMENGDHDALAFWNLCRTLSIEKYKKLYGEIGIRFDVYSGESHYVQSAKAIIDDLNKNSSLFAADSALKIDLSSSQWLADAEDRYKRPVLARSNGTTLYLARDVAAAIDRYRKYKFDRMIYVTDVSQSVHFQQLFAILERMGFFWAQKSTDALIHKPFGRIEKMKTRQGDIVFLNDILKEAFDKAFQDRSDSETRKVDIKDDEVTKIVALSGLIYHDLHYPTSKKYKFNWEAALASKGSSGLYLQYTYSRLCSLEKYTGVRVTDDIDPVFILHEPLLTDILQHVSEYAELTEALFETLEPSVLVKYLYELCRRVSKAFKLCIVKDQPAKDAEARLACYHAAKVVLGNGMTILGMSPLEQH